MMTEIVAFLLILAGALVLFVTEFLAVDVTALLLLVVLLFTGFLDIGEAVSGFSNKAVLTVAALFVLSHALVKTGILEVFSSRLGRIAGRSASLAIAVFLVSVSLLSGFINNTACVAIFLPLAIRFAQRLEISPSKLLIPLSYATIYGGLMTLIGTSTNLLASSVVERYGIEPLGMFEFTSMGIVFLVIGTVYNLAAAPRLLPSRAGVSGLARSYHMAAYVTEFRLPADSPLVGSTPAERRISEAYDITVLAIIRRGMRHVEDLRRIRLEEGDVLLARGTVPNFLKFRQQEKARMLTDVKMSQKELAGEESLTVEGLVVPQSSLIGTSLREFNFRSKFGAFVLAIQREGKTLREKIAHTPLQMGDTLLIFVPRRRLASLAESNQLAILQEHPVSLHRVRFWWLAVATIPMVIFVSALEWFDILEASLAGVVLLLVARVLRPQEAYKAIDWTVIVTIAAFIPVGLVVERTGVAELMAKSLIGLGSFFPPGLAPHATLAILFLTTILLTAIISNNSAVIVLLPISLAVANALAVSARPFIFAACIGASIDFMTPIGYQTNLMVYGPGHYRFGDYVRAGAPLNLLFWVVGSLLIPVFWPFHP